MSSQTLRTPSIGFFWVSRICMNRGRFERCVIQSESLSFSHKKKGERLNPVCLQRVYWLQSIPYIPISLLDPARFPVFSNSVITSCQFLSMAQFVSLPPKKEKKSSYGPIRKRQPACADSYDLIFSVHLCSTHTPESTIQP